MNKVTILSFEKSEFDKFASQELRLKLFIENRFEYQDQRHNEHLYSSDQDELKEELRNVEKPDMLVQVEEIENLCRLHNCSYFRIESC